MWRTALIASVLLCGCKKDKDEPRPEGERPRGEGPAPEVVTAPEPVAAAPDAAPVAAAAASVLVAIPAGCFQMGAVDEYQPQMGPVHEVCLDAFQLDSLEVSNAQYAKCVADKKCEPATERDGSTDANLPVVGVTWEQADAYCKAQGQQLPSEAQWEYAARGTASRIYPYGSDFDCTAANVQCEGNPGRTAPVGSFAKDKTPEGVFDLGGNVSEWVADLYDPEFYGKSPKQNPVSTESGSNMKHENRVLRGASFGSSRDYTAAALREFMRPVVEQDKIGFRCAK